jgi:hypothetical protein
MRVDYSLLRKAGYGFSKQLMIIVGLIALPITMRLEKVASAEPISTPRPSKSVPTLDPRTVRLTTFFSKLRCPVTYLSQDFVDAADENALDWRLLPSISVVESGGGKAARNNNLFGWDNGNQFFPTLRAGINHVAFKLGRSALYRNHDSAGKLRIYNHDENYVHAVLDVMNRISPVVNLKACSAPGC